MMKAIWCHLFHANRWGWPKSNGEQECNACLRVRRTCMYRDVK